MNMTGTFPDGILEYLPFLMRLELSLNHLNGPLPSLTAAVMSSNTHATPRIDQALRHLVHLELNENELSGTIPSDWYTSLRNIQNVEIRYNELNGTAFPSLLPLNSSSGYDNENFNINTTAVIVKSPDSTSSNNVSTAAGTTMEPIWWRDLKVLDYGYNHLGGALPKSWMNQKIQDSLSSLCLNHNEFTGTIPDGLVQLPFLTLLDLGYNQFTGLLPLSQFILPTEQSSNTTGTTLVVSQNTTSTNTTNATLVISQNTTTTNNTTTKADIEVDFDLKPSKLQEIMLNNNYLTGSIPNIWYSILPELKRLELSGNELNGAVSSSVSRLEQLQYMNLNRNSFSGTIPREFSSLTQLQTLSLFGNQFNGIMPDEICSLRSSMIPTTTIASSLMNSSDTKVPLGLHDLESDCFDPDEDVILTSTSILANSSDIAPTTTSSSNTVGTVNPLLLIQLSDYKSGIVCPCCTKCCAVQTDAQTLNCRSI